MKIKQILNEWEDDHDPRDYEPDMPDLDYDGSIDPEIDNIEGPVWSLYVNEADAEMKNGVTFQLAADHDDGVVWEVDMGAPRVSHYKQGAPATRWDPAEDDDVEWERDLANDEDVRVDDMTQDPTLKQFVHQITAALSKLKEVDQDSVHNIFKPVLARLNGGK